MRQLNLALIRLMALSFVFLQYAAVAQRAEDPLAKQIRDLSRSEPGGKQSALAEQRAGAIMGEIDAGLKQQRAPSVVNPRFAIVSHLRGNEGIPFPQPNEVKLEPVATPSANEDGSEIKNESSTGFQAPVFWVDPPKRVYRPTACTESKTVVVPRPAKGDPKHFVFDRLYVSRDLIPIDSSDIYGVNTDVLSYEGDGAESVLLRMQSDKVPCVPYRIRFSDTQAYYHFGEDALANYDKNPTDRGEMHAWVRRQIERK
jgi:hypothetical protein